MLMELFATAFTRKDEAVFFCRKNFVQEDSSCVTCELEYNNLAESVSRGVELSWVFHNTKFVHHTNAVLIKCKGTLQQFVMKN
jgi:hypothetical protein